MTASVPAVDVLIPVFNGAATLRDALDSILGQTLQDFRIVIVDDGSTDDTARILRDLAGRDARLHVVSQTNGGIVDAMNAGLEHCRADYVARFDADDISYPHRLETQLAYLGNHPECVAVGGAVDHMDEHGRPIHGLPHPGQPSLASATWVPAREPYLIHPFMMARRASLIAAGGYRHVQNSEDSDLFWRLSDTGALYNIENVVGRYRVHLGSISSASILNGRIMAVSSQLAALSALRRRAGREDIVFRKSMAEAYRSAATLDGICRVASAGLEPQEADHLRLAAAAKLLELAGYRPYELEISDCRFIRGVMSSAEQLPESNRNDVRWHVTVAAARLLRTGRLRECLALTSLTDYPVVAARALLAKPAMLKRFNAA